MKEGFGKLTSLKEAKEVILNLIKEKNDEIIELDRALKRVLAEDIIAKIDVPHFKKSAMDGFAVRAKDTFGATNVNPKELRVIGSVKIGTVPKKTITNRECMAVSTGCMLPNGADSVLMVEFTERKNHKITIYKAVTPGENIIDIGSDIKKGKLVGKKGELINPRTIGNLASQGIKKIRVKKKPVVAYFSIGDEIIKAGEKLEKGKIYDINSKTIIAGLKEYNCDVIDLGIVKDNKEKIKETIKKGLRADFIIFSGGSSLGEKDLMCKAVSEIGTILIHGIAVKPGKPVLVGKVKNKLVLGLPGYPTSSLSNFYILVIPIIEKMLNVRYPLNTIKARLARKVVSTIGRYEFMAVKIEDNRVIPIMRGSSSITTLSEADGFIEIEENTEVLEKDSLVTVRLF